MSLHRARTYETEQKQALHSDDFGFLQLIYHLYLIYHLFLKDIVMQKVLSSGHKTHLTGSVFAELCQQMGIQGLQSSENIEKKQHRTLKNALNIICDELNSQ